MILEKITLIRDNSKESAKASKMLRDNEVEFREVFSDPERIMPVLIVPGRAYSYRGYNNIFEYVSSLNPSQKNSQSNQE